MTYLATFNELLRNTHAHSSHAHVCKRPFYCYNDLLGTQSWRKTWNSSVNRSLRRRRRDRLLELELNLNISNSQRKTNPKIIEYLVLVFLKFIEMFSKKIEKQIKAGARNMKIHSFLKECFFTL